MTFALAVDYLLENGYLAVINHKITITGKFNREFNPVPRERINQIFPEAPEVISREAIWKKFIEDAKIPYKVTATDGKQYTIRQYSPGICDKLIKIIKQVDNYKILTESTRLYYESNTYKFVLSNYIDRRVWEDEYNRYKAAVDTGTLAILKAAGSGGNKFED